MAAPKFETCETESAGEEFEDVALLLESNLEQQSSRSSPSWKDKLMSYFARGNARSHTGFEKLDQSDNVQEGSHRTQGTGCLHFKQQQNSMCFVSYLPGLTFCKLCNAVKPVHICEGSRYECCTVVALTTPLAEQNCFRIRKWCLHSALGSTAAQRMCSVTLFVQLLITSLSTHQMVPTQQSYFCTATYTVLASLKTLIGV